jgi:hypothetical protein
MIIYYHVVVVLVWPNTVVKQSSMPSKRASRPPTQTCWPFLRHGKNATTAINRCKIKWRWIYHLLLFRLRRKPMAIPETASGIN